jgi:uncharacterized protein GlcG (DUF336 family)
MRRLCADKLTQLPAAAHPAESDGRVALARTMKQRGRPEIGARMRVKPIVLAAAAAMTLAALPARADEAIVTYKSLAPDVAFDLARAALQACRKDGYQVAVAVLDRFGAPLVLLRDRYAGLPALDIATDKAWTAIGFHANTSDLAKSMETGRLPIGQAGIPRIVMVAGGVTIESAGALLGAVGVAGAPGGDKDEACAQAGVDAIRSKVEF